MKWEMAGNRYRYKAAREQRGIHVQSSDGVWDEYKFETFQDNLWKQKHF